MIELIQRNKRESVILYLLLILFCIINIVININGYKQVIFGYYNEINNIDDLNNNYRFAYVNMNNATLEQYSIENKEIKANIYTLQLDDKKVLVLLKENTIITDKVPVEIIKGGYVINDISNTINSNDYYNVSLSNVNYNENINIEKNKVYLIFIILAVCIFLLITNFIGMINPKKTIKYRRYIKKNN